MNKYKILGVVLMLSIILMIVVSYKLDTGSIQYATSSITHFLDFLSKLCIILFGSLAVLTLDTKDSDY